MPRPLAVLLLAYSFAPAADPLKTVGEASEFETTSTSAEVVQFCRALAQADPKVKYTTYGASGEGKPLPLLVLSDPPVGKASEAKKPVVLVTANIHAGEVDGKEAVLALARDLAADKDSAVLKKLVVVIAPNFNPDGNDRFGEWRPTQDGPKRVGTRTNAAGLDLNRDFVKLETPETRGVVGLLSDWNPVLVIDCHTTNGSYHRYTLTYDGPRNPAADPKLIDYARSKLFPAVGEAVKKATGFDSFAYGDFDDTHEAWVTYGTGPRYGTQLYSLRGSVGVLSESYTYASFADRVKASYAFVKGNFEYAAAHADELKKLTDDAKTPRKTVTLRAKAVARDKPLTVLGWVEETKDGKTVRTDTPKDYTCRILDKLEPTREVTLPPAYLFPAEYAAAALALRRQGVIVEELREGIELDVEEYTVTASTQAEKEFQKHRTRTVDATAAKAVYRAEPGAYVVRTNEHLGQLAAYLLEPEAEDGLTTWNFFDKGLAVKGTFPVRRLVGEPALFTEKVAAPDAGEKRKFDLPDLEKKGGLGGTPVGSLTWLDDGEHWLQAKNKRVWKVDARTGRSELFVDPDKLYKSLAGFVTEPDKRVAEAFRKGVEGPNYTFNPQRSAVLARVNDALYLAFRDGSAGKKLADGPGVEVATFSPDGARLAYVLKGNLFAVKIAGGETTQLTADGGKDEILNGRADWVYEEEIFSRNGQAYWWSPDGKRIAFLRFDDSKVPVYTVVNADGKPEAIRYPKAGQTNPTVTLGVIDVTADKPAAVFAEMGEYNPADTLFARVGWVPGDKPVPFTYLQNRTQTWLDVVKWPALTDKPVKLFRETTKAWVEDLGEPKFLKDGTFLILSERTGWKHVYHYSADGKDGVAITEGKWQVKGIERVDEASGDVYVTGTKASATGNHLLLANLNGGEVEVLSPLKSTHAVSLAPVGSLYLDRQSDDFTPTQTVLRQLRAKPVRVIDANPVRERERYQFGKYERHQIKTADGFELEAAITYPPDFHPLNRYPVWVLTYAGPHTPTVRDGWGSGRVMEQVIAASGVAVVRVDPRSASGKGAESAWTCYKKLGVGELKDLETAVDWIGKNPWADAARVGLSGHSYGGFITAYALTHSKKFAAGVAGAPVTDWHYYDTVYTERYMGLPAENEGGYEATSVVTAAKNLSGKLLLCHGLIDDNVHPQNSLRLIEELQKEGREFEVMVYPGSRHPILPAHYPQAQVRFIRKALGVK